MSWDPTNSLLGLGFTPWSRGNGNSNKNTGNMPSYPNGAYQNCAFTNVGLGRGFLVNGGDGIFSPSVDDRVQSALNIANSDSSKISFEFWINRSAGNNENLGGAFDDVNNYYNIFIYTDETVQFGYKKGGTNRYARTSTTLSAGINHIVCVKDGATLKIYINGSEASYSTQLTYNHGSFSTTANLALCGIQPGLIQSVSNFHWAWVYSDALTGARISANYALGRTMGLYGFNTGDSMDLETSDTTIVTPFDFSNLILSLHFNAWSRGNGTVNKFSGNMPSYPSGAYQNCQFNNTISGQGHVPNSRDGYYKSNDTDSFIQTALNIAHSDASVLTVEAFIDRVNGTFSNIAGGSDDINNYYNFFINNDNKIWFTFQKAGVSRRVQSNEALSAGLNHIVFVKDGSILKIYINSLEASYAVLNTYDHGNFSLTNDFCGPGVDVSAGGLQPVRDDVHYVNVYNVAIDGAKIKNDYLLGRSSGLYGYSDGDVMSLEAQERIIGGKSISIGVGVQI